MSPVNTTTESGYIDGIVGIIAANIVSITKFT